MSQDRLGTVSRTGDTFELVFERRIAKPVEKVWAAITVPERIADWFAIVEIDLRLGGHYRLRFSPEETPTEGVIVEYEPLRRLAHTWPDPGHADAIVRYELEPDGDGCRLRFSQNGLPAKYVESIAGWHVFLDAIPGAIDGVRFVWSMEQEKAVLQLYKARLAAVGVSV
ncbi:MAG: SRPBCC family protein [Phenylobacterium sp.]|uniref:SRPBCC family protein n=1 Tax=Phenylobacterium sp. TaxID=1871053 RepID=UPI002733494D|nr:SRPBCC family protein [Phenylobacterium sp.]MDP3747456.1 SRPBCC family protein [Phenylobacterium sp.]